MTDHQFIRTTDASKMPDQRPTPIVRAVPGAVIVCAICGEVRAVFEDGTVVVRVEGKTSAHGPSPE